MFPALRTGRSGRGGGSAQAAGKHVPLMQMERSGMCLLAAHTSGLSPVAIPSQPTSGLLPTGWGPLA